MDVRCERCKTLYELDDARVSEAGTTVRCTTCGHVFRLRKKVLLMTEAVGDGGESTAVPPPLVEKPAWRVRSPSGRVIAFRELTSMQKWIVERKFGRDDEISLHGDHWRRLGDIAELQPFFLLLDEVDRVHELEERLRRAELPEEAPSRLEEELGGSNHAPPPAPTFPTPTPTPIRLEMPIEAPPEAARKPEPDLVVPEPAAPASPSLAEPPRPGPPSAFSLEESREATRPSPDDLPVPEGTVEPQEAAEDAEHPVHRAPRPGRRPGRGGRQRGLGAPTTAEQGSWVATVLVLAAVGGAAAACFQIWVPARRRSSGRRPSGPGWRTPRRPCRGRGRGPGARAPGQEGCWRGWLGVRMQAPEPPRRRAAQPSTPGRAAAPPESPRGSADPPDRTAPTSPASTVASAPPPPRTDPARPRAKAEPRARTFEGWMAKGDRERAHARARAALDAYDRAITLDPGRPEAHLAQGRALLDVGDARSAVAAFRRALAVNPRYSVAEFWLGEAYRRTGQTTEAAEAYRRYLEAAPEGAEAAPAREALNALR
jgi:predicted Zn finger-like uncharacterized protein